MNSIFNLGKCEIKKEKYQEFDIIYIYDFWQNPDDILNLINNTESDLYWKLAKFSDFQKDIIVKKINNGKFFEDRRHQIESAELKVAHNYVASLIGINNIEKTQGYGKLVTNIHKIYNHPFNDYQNNWWTPHKDGNDFSKNIYTCLWYFNKEDKVNGTNIYEQTEHYQQPTLNNPSKEHIQEQINPWVPKKFYERKKLLEPIYNSAVIFPGGKCFHGMNIENDRYSNEYRINAALFLGAEG